MRVSTYRQGVELYKAGVVGWLKDLKQGHLFLQANFKEPDVKSQFPTHHRLLTGSDESGLDDFFA